MSSDEYRLTTGTIWYRGWRPSAFRDPLSGTVYLRTAAGGLVQVGRKTAATFIPGDPPEGRLIR